MRENTREHGPGVSGSRLDLPAIKKLCEALPDEWRALSPGRGCVPEGRFSVCQTRRDG